MAPGRMHGHVNRRTAVATGAAAVAIGYGWLATASEPFTWHVRIFTAAAGVVVVGAAIRRRWHRKGGEHPPVRLDAAEVGALAIWGLLVGVAVMFQLTLLFSHPRSVHPTLSSLMNMAFSSHGVRALGFAAWVGLAAYLLRR